MTKSYIGLSCSGHDNALAIVDADGKLRFAEGSERHLQSKRALNAPADDLGRCRQLLQDYCNGADQLVLAKTWSKAAPQLSTVFAQELQGRLERLSRYAQRPASPRMRAILEFQKSRLHTRLRLVEMGHSAMESVGRNLALSTSEPPTWLAFEHHLTHAATACFMSPFERATCLVVDGIGEGLTVSAFRYEDGALGPIGPSPDGDPASAGSLGLFYSDVCMLCGFDPFGGEEWKVMGLAPYGRPDDFLLRNLRQCIQVQGLGLVTPPEEMEAMGRLAKRRRPPDCPVQQAADLAYAGQLVFEERLAELTQALYGHSPSDNLVLTGGCALNSSANGRLLEGSSFERLYVPPAPGDDGNAVGAALLAFQADSGRGPDPSELGTPYLGSELCSRSLERLLQSGAFPSARRLGPEALVELVAGLLSQGRLVGWAQGRAELGPRALGNRSILADPRRQEMKARINALVKFREDYRPFAPAILHAHGPDYFEHYADSPYMERTLRFRPEVRERIPAVVHTNGTGRLQSVTRERTPLFHALLEAFYARTGEPVLLNTSFNVMGKPIVHSVEDAVAVFATSGLDVLVLQDIVITKEPHPCPAPS